MKPLRTAIVAGVSLLVAFASLADPFAENVRPTNAIAAEAESKLFHLPPGFEIQLVASEPDIGKPFNIAFDAKGRLWITVSNTYPYPAKDGKDPMDRIMILDDFDDRGHARKITTFADHLNIPIGVYPYGDGCIAYTIPNITYFRDTDGDGKADKQETLVGPFSFDRDTHGMASNFRRGLDGWLYGCHGFNNITHAKAKDGSELNLNSGNTYRFKVDGSHAEQFTWGQTNPFGLAFDDLGNLYSSDSHSKPFYQLIRGGYYEGIGKQHDGLGFAPMMMNHFHNSTAIASTFIYTADTWPAEFRNNYFCGNVVTSRINRDSVTYSGTTPIAKEEPDFLTTEDPWFRPVQLQMGPDGAMWVADFYNKIIGHYEVPLTHPGRDHTHGRIWRIVYKGTDGKVAPPPWHGDLTKADVPALLETLKSPNLMLRMLATDQLSDRVGTAAVPQLVSLLKSNPTSNQIVHAMWTLFRLQDDARLPAAIIATKNDDPAVRVQAMRFFSELPLVSRIGDLIPDIGSIVVEALNDPDVRVQRAAVDALGTHPAGSNLRPLLDLQNRVAADDSHLQYTLKVALRETLRSPGVFSSVPAVSQTEAKLLADIALAIPTEDSGRYLAAFIANPANNAAQNGAFIHHVIRYAPVGESQKLIDIARTQDANNPDAQLSIAKAIQEGSAERGIPLSAEMLAWQAELAGRLLAEPGQDPPSTFLRQQAGADLARTLKLANQQPSLRKIISDFNGGSDARIAACKALAAIDPDANAPLLAGIIGADKEEFKVREGAVDALGIIPTPTARAAFLDVISRAPSRLQTKAARVMISGPDGGEALLLAVTLGKISPRVLHLAGIREALVAAKVPDVDARLKALTKGLPPLGAETQALIDQRRATYPTAKTSVDAGFKIFTTNCIACHAIDGKGAVVGPQLDGIGNRGLDRVLEDVLDPNRSVDPAFHSWTVKLKDGTEITGLLRREEGATIVYADATGKEIAVPKSQIASRTESNLSLMPGNFGEIIPPEDFNHLMAFLLSKNATKK